MSQAGNSGKQKSILQRPGCLIGFGFGFIGIVGLTIIGLLFMGYTWYQIKNEEISFVEEQIPDMEHSVDELPGGENPAPALEEESALPDDVDISDLAGIYVGRTNFLDQRVEDWGGGAITENEITITISEEGIVTGTFVVRFESSEKSNENCAWRTIETDNGVIFGQISESTGTITLDSTSTQELIREDISGLCALTDDQTTETEHHREFSVTISGKTMTGDGAGDKTFEATKQ